MPQNPRRAFPSRPPRWGQNGQNLVEIDTEDDEEARKREMEPIEIFVRAE